MLRVITALCAHILALSLQSAAKRLEQHAQGVNAAELAPDTLQQLLNECVQVWTTLAAALSLLHPLVQRWQRTLGEDGGNE